MIPNYPETIKVFDIDWESKTAGPSEDGTRTEVFLSGCKKAREGNPCKDCFNQLLWKEVIKDTNISDLINTINKYSRNKNITIVGGEPTDQLQSLIRLCVELKALDYHIIVFTYKRLEELLSEKNQEREDYLMLLSSIDMLIDGQYDSEQKIFDDENNGFAYNLIGSANQVVWHCYHDNSFSFLQLRGNRASDFAKHVSIQNRNINSKKLNFARCEIYPFTFSVEDLYDFYYKVFINKKEGELFWTQIKK